MPRKKILVVDDAATARMLEGMILKEACYEVVSARDGIEALEKAKEEKPDLILLDVVMPRMGGLEACKRLRKELGIANIPIIMVTSRGDQGIVEASYAHGCSEFVTKPVDSAELLAKVRSCLGELEEK